MHDMVFYILKTIACSGIFMGYYWLFLRNGRFYNWNRFYLLFTMVVSLLIPLLYIPIYMPQPVEAIPYVDNTYIATDITTTTPILQINTNTIILLLYTIIIGLLLISGLKALWRIVGILKKSDYKKLGNIKVYYTQNEAAPFSFFNTIFWRDNIDINSTNGQCILMHELTHIKAKHTYDKVFAQFICILFWINPFFWLIKRELDLVHEFAADDACLVNNNTQVLSASILQLIYPNNYLQFTSQFFQSPIKRRLVMLTKNKKIGFKQARQFMLIPTLALVVCLFAIHIEAKPIPIPTPEPTPIPKPELIALTDTVITQPVQNNDTKNTQNEVFLFAVIETKPLFQDQSGNTFPAWVQSQIKYPEEAIKKNIQGVVYIGLTIGTDGKLSNINVLRSADPILDKEALRVVKLSPDWTPGKYKGKAVPVSFQFPVKFICDTDKKDTTPLMHNDNEPFPFAEVETKPLFQNQPASTFPVWVAQQVKYPEDGDIQAVVYVRFIIGVDGKLSNIGIIRSVHPLLDEEALRIVKSSPDWTPGKNNGKAVPVSYQLPIRFQLAN